MGLKSELMDPNILLCPDYPKLNNLILELVQHRDSKNANFRARFKLYLYY